jgi:RNA polymerase sigma-70 factor (ECF subfamily)
MSPDDTTRLESLRQGDLAAAAALAESYRPGLVRFARSMLGNDAAAEDAAQEALARLNGVAQLPEGQLRPWLYRVTRNLCLDILRRRKASPTWAGQMPTACEPARSTAGPATRVAAAERDELIRRILDSMPEEYRSVLLLKHFEELSRQEIAAVLEISETAVKGRLVRASEYLREELRKLTGSGT